MTMNDTELDKLLCSISALIVMALHETNQLNIEKQSIHNSALSGARLIQEWLEGHWRVCFDNLGMMQDVFKVLCGHLRTVGLRDTRNVAVEEQLAIFIWIMRHNVGVRLAGHRFQHSEDTISRYYSIL